jgi:hypothetical protein
MKRIVTACLLLALLVLILPVGEAAAQTVTIKREAISPRLRTGPTGTWQISSGLRVVGKGMKVFLSADTTGLVTSFAWSFTSKPTGSTAAIDTPSNKFVRFTPDLNGQYAVQVVANGSITAYDTIFASTYQGQALSGGTCALCHAGTIPQLKDNFTPWKSSKHATILMRGISGQLEVSGTLGGGVYATACIKCHTTGHEPNVDNGNFGYLARVTGWDTTWYRPYTYWQGQYIIPYNDSTAIRQMYNSYPTLVSTANIGCESCHGPGNNHWGTLGRVDKSYDAGVCNQCHDAPSKHRLSSYWAASKHAIFAEGGHTGQNSCYPCHSGTAFAKWVDNNKVGTSYWNASDANKNISCAVCHEPHGNSNPHQLRTVAIDSLRNGYRTPANIGGTGYLCANCHNARYSVKARVTTTPPYYGFVNRYGPHYNNQADMYFGSNGYQYNDQSLTGQMTHAGVENSCVTCHMAERVVGSSVHPNHEMAMVDSLGHDIVTACRDCHGSHVESFEDIMAFSDYDQDGTIEPVKLEIQGLLDRLRAWLPKDSTTGEPCNMMYDSLKVKNRPDYVQGIWNYYFVKNDKSMGMHNTKYTVALLQKALGIYPLDVNNTGGTIPTEFALRQNYPNPFNPSTTISFSLPEKSSVRLEIYDVLGKLVTTLVDNEMEPGNFKISWHGKDQSGLSVASGIYLYRLQAGSNTAMKKMVLLK